MSKVAWRVLRGSDDLVNCVPGDESTRSWFDRFAYFRDFYSTLTSDPRVVVQLDDVANVRSFLPGFLASQQTYTFFHPDKLLRAILKRAGKGALLRELSLASDRPFYVAAIPFAYYSPFSTIAPEDVSYAMDLFESAAAADGVNDFACLYYSSADIAVGEALQQRGYLVAKLEANAVLEISRSWSSLEGYFAGRRHGKKERKEWKAFNEAGYQCFWHGTLSDDLIHNAVKLEAHLLKIKGEEFAENDLCNWYQAVRYQLPLDHLLLEVRDRTGEAAAMLTFLKDGTRLTAKAIGMIPDQENFLYFSAAYYEAVRYCIENSYSSIDYGPSAGIAKKRRGAQPLSLSGAFKFAPGHPAERLWAQIASELEAYFTELWK